MGIETEHRYTHAPAMLYNKRLPAKRSLALGRIDYGSRATSRAIQDRSLSGYNSTRNGGPV